MKKFPFLAILVAISLFAIMGCKKETSSDDPTPSGLAVLSTAAISSISQTGAQSGGNITSDGGNPVTARGICWSTTASPTVTDQKTMNGSGIGSFTAVLTSLTPEIKYFVRAYATNSKGTAYGNELSFTTPTPVYTATDADGNLYHGITIGEKVWLVENLRTTHYRNGDPIPNVTDQNQWKGLSSGAYCAYLNNASNSSVYGYLYNFFALSDPRGIAPVGYHVATESEWNDLSTFLGGKLTCGGKLKETGTTHWTPPNAGATNSTGFTALPGGRRTDNEFGHIRDFGYFWTSSKTNDIPWIFYLNYNIESLSAFGLYGTETYGNAIRCVKD